MKKFFKAIGKFFKKLGYSIAAFFVLTVREMKKVRWPSRKVLIDASKIVLSFVVLFGLYIMLDDFIIAKLLKLIKY